MRNTTTNEAWKPTQNRIWIIRREKIGAGPKGETIAPTDDELGTCDCCGKRIALLHHMDNGDTLGKECAIFFSRPGARPWTKITRKLSDYAERYGIDLSTGRR